MCNFHELHEDVVRQYAKIARGFLRSSLQGSMFELEDLLQDGAVVTITVLQKYGELHSKDELKRICVESFVNAMRNAVAAKFSQRRSAELVPLDVVESVVASRAHDGLYIRVFVSEVIDMLNKLDAEIVCQYLFGVDAQALAMTDATDVKRKRGHNVVRVRAKHVAQALAISEHVVRATLHRVACIARREWNDFVESPLKGILAQ